MNNQTSEDLLSLARMLAQRLERLSADSVWAHRASGARGSLLRQLDMVESLQKQGDGVLSQKDLDRLEMFVQAGFKMLERAAREIS